MNMKNKFINAIAVSMVLLLAGCEKSDDYKAEFQHTSPGDALLKVIYASAYTSNPSVQLSIDDVRVSGLLVGRTPFPGGGYNTIGSNFPDYLVLKPGAKKLTIAIPKKGTNVDSVVLYTTQLNLSPGENHTLNIMDTFTRTKSLLVVDELELPRNNTVKYRFVNLMPNVPKIDLYYGTTRVAADVAYNTPGIVFVMDVPLTLAWSIRETGTSPTSTALATYTSASTVADQRIFTAFAMGYKGSTATNTRPYISFAVNR